MQAKPEPNASSRDYLPPKQKVPLGPAESRLGIPGFLLSCPGALSTFHHCEITHPRWEYERERERNENGLAKNSVYNKKDLRLIPRIARPLARELHKAAPVVKFPLGPAGATTDKNGVVSFMVPPFAGKGERKKRERTQGVGGKSAAARNR